MASPKEIQRQKLQGQQARTLGHEVAARQRAATERVRQQLQHSQTSLTAHSKRHAFDAELILDAGAAVEGACCAQTPLQTEWTVQDQRRFV